MDEQHPLAGYREKLQPVIRSKVEEFHLLGYDGATSDDIWECMLNKVWKKKKKVANKMLHEMVEDIFHLSINDYMSYLTVEAYKGPDLFVDDLLNSGQPSKS